MLPQHTNGRGQQPPPTISFRMMSTFSLEREREALGKMTKFIKGLDAL